MPFPMTGVLDDFNRANVDPLNTSWSGPLWSGEGQIAIVSNAAKWNGASGAGGSYYDTLPGADCEAYVTITTRPPAAGSVGLYARITSPGGSLDGYAVGYVRGTPDVVTIYRLDNGSFTALGATINTTLADGDGLGIRCVGSTISAWARINGTWAQLGARSDSTYSGPGVAAIEVGSTTTVLDDFGGGEFIPRGYHRLAGPVQLTTEAADLYTVPDGARASIRHVYINNPSDVIVKPTLAIVEAQGLLSNSAEGGTDGTTVTTGNSGGDSGDAFNVVSIGGAGTLTFDNDFPALGSLAYKVVVSGGAIHFDWSTAIGGTITEIWGRFYVYSTNFFSHNPMWVKNNAAAGGAGIYTTGGGLIRLMDSIGSVSDGGVVVPDNALSRIEFHYVAGTSTGLIEVKLFTDPFSSTPSDTETFANRNTRVDCDRVQFGNIDATTTTPLWIDSIALSTTGYLGPDLEEPASRFLDLQDIPAGEAFDTRRRTHHALAAGETVQGHYDSFDGTNILDDFDRADGSLGANWTAGFGGTLDTISSNRVHMSQAGAQLVMEFYNASADFLDSEVFAECAVVDSVSGGLAVYARVQGSAATPTCYGGRSAHDSLNSTIEFVKYVNGTGEFVDQTGDLPGGLVDGDTIGLQVLGDGDDVTLRFWRKPAGGSWTMHKEVIDSDANRIVTPGKLGIGNPNTSTFPTSARMDNFGGGPIGYASQVLADSPLVYYRMHDASGNLVDSSGNARDGSTAYGTRTYEQPGPILSDPNSKSILINTGGFTTAQAGWMDLGDGPFTLEGWIRRASLGQNEWMFDRGGNGSVGGYRVFIRNDTPDKIHFSEATVTDNFESDQAFDVTDKWWHIVATKNGSDINFYIDGVAATGTEVNSTFEDNADDLYIGDLYQQNGTTHAYLAEMAIYGTVLSAERVMAHYRAAQAPVIILDGYVEEV